MPLPGPTPITAQTGLLILVFLQAIAQVVELKTFSEPDLGEDDVRISMEAAPINPSDFLLIRGRYGIRPTLPFGLGAEGSAVLAT